ncbi:MAG: DUF3990 domain-containing protein, partial [Prevotellaceae bacterium]|nr:DUF3990 domain-containing protein [Prevotellaceae bacterium]
MELFHGSNISVPKPELLDSLRGLDFGRGFYATSNREQAKRFTENVVRRKKWGERTVTIYEVNEIELFDACSLLKFGSADEKWLDFVVQNRTLSYKGKAYDVIAGPVANDAVFNVIDLYLDGILDKKETIKRLKIRELFNQWAFCSKKAISFLVTTQVAYFIANHKSNKNSPCENLVFFVSSWYFSNHKGT